MQTLNAIREEMQDIIDLFNPITAAKYVLKAVQEEIQKELKIAKPGAKMPLIRLEQKIIESIKIINKGGSDVGQNYREN